MRLKLCLTIWGEDELVEEFRVEEPWIRLSGSGSIASLLRIARDRDVLPHLETHLKVFGNLVQVPSELIGGRRLVEGRIVPHGPEQWFPLVLILAILSQALSRENVLLAYCRL